MSCQWKDGGRYRIACRDGWCQIWALGFAPCPEEDDAEGENAPGG